MFTHKFPLKFQNPQIQLIFATVYSTIFYMMEEAIIEKTVAALRRNHFEVFIATDKEDARRIFFNEIFPHLQVESVSWGDSETMKATGVLSHFIGKTETLREKTAITLRFNLVAGRLQLASLSESDPREHSRSAKKSQ